MGDSRGWRSGGGGNPARQKAWRFKKKMRRVYKEQCGRRRERKDWLAWHDQLGGLTGC